MERTTEGALVALLEDEPQVATIIQRTLTDFGFRTVVYPNANHFLSDIVRQRPALCIVDLNLPDADGIEVVEKVKNGMSCGILILTSRISLDERVQGLECGADDYITKPFDPRELVARVRSVLRRCQSAVVLKVRQVACFGDWTFNFWTNTLLSNSGIKHVLSVNESEVLIQFLSNPKRIIAREKLSPIPDSGHLDRTIDVRISRLRNTLEIDPHKPSLIQTIYGTGYIFTADVMWKTES
jgi:DNA-binding response OmpR family regulator